MTKVDILLPCYNERVTLSKCIKKIKKVIDKEKYDYRIVLCDNNSIDNSRDIAKKEKVKILVEKEKGYGSTLLNGISKSNAEYIVMLDCDLSYNEKDIPKMLNELDNGYDLVIGNRFNGGIEKNAMTLSHKIGVKFLTKYANLLFRTSSHDYHCGLRVFKRNKMIECNLKSKGFEFASEMIIKAKLNKLKIKEVSTNLFKDGRNSKSHLRTIRDGFRHLFLINKLKFESSWIFKYISSFVMLIVCLFLSLLITSLIPNKYIYNNTLKSFEFFENYYREVKAIGNEIFLLEGCGDVRNLSIAYNMDSSKPIDSIIRMSYVEEVDKIKNLKDIFINKEGNIVNYSRYWHGQAMYSKIMLLFMPLGYTMYFIQLGILILLFLLVIKKLYQKSIFLTISFFISCLFMNIFYTAFSVQYYFVSLLMFIFSFLVIKLYENKSKNVGLLFAMSGGLTCFFDFLTCETLTLTVPLFIYIFLSIKDNKDNIIKDIIKYIFIWGVFYSFTFFTKWFISMLYFGFDYLNVILSHLFVRVVDSDFSIFESFVKTILLTFKNIIPFNMLESGVVIFLIWLLYSLHLLVFDYKKYLLLLIPVIIPIIRFFIVSNHSYFFSYFTYRALLVLVMLLLLISFLKIKELFLKKSLID